MEKKLKDEEIIKNFLTQMATQDNRSTADIFYYTIRDKEKYQTADGCGEETWYRYEDETYESRDELSAYLKGKGLTWIEVDDEISMHSTEMPMAYRWIHKGMFLTETDAKDHLQMNRYHYGPDAHDYVCHAWRAPDMYNFFKSLFDYFGIEKKWG